MKISCRWWGKASPCWGWGEYLWRPPVCGVQSGSCRKCPISTKITDCSSEDMKSPRACHDILDAHPDYPRFMISLVSQEIWAITLGRLLPIASALRNSFLVEWWVPKRTADCSQPSPFSDLCHHDLQAGNYYVILQVATLRDLPPDSHQK